MKDKIKKVFLEVYNREVETDWSEAANIFIEWIVENDFKLESFDEFVEWLDEELVDNTWNFFFGYQDDYNRFANDWVSEGEKQDYLKFATEN